MGLQKKEHPKQQQALMAANRIAASWMLVFERFDGAFNPFNSPMETTVFLAGRAVKKSVGFERLDVEKISVGSKHGVR